MKKIKPDSGLPEEYLDILKKSLTRYITDDGYLSLYQRTHGKTKHLIYKSIEKLLNPFDLELVKKNQFNPLARRLGKDWPSTAETMIGLKRLDNIQKCMVDVLKKDIKGDFIETGVWRGGATILMRGILKAYAVKDRTVWVADSFKGLPKPTDASCKIDLADHLWTYSQLSVSLKEVKKNFAKYGLLDNQVRFLKGWFKDTLPNAPIKGIAVLRLDGDMYESTIDALSALYPKLSFGGYVIVDDYTLPACKKAVTDYRKKMKISDPPKKVDWASVYWQKTD